MWSHKTESIQKGKTDCTMHSHGARHARMNTRPQRGVKQRERYIRPSQTGEGGWVEYNTNFIYLRDL